MPEPVGTLVDAALSAPSGIFNVGAEPVRRSRLVEGFAAAVGRRDGVLVGSRLAGRRLEPLTRSLRVSSSCFARETGWRAGRREFDVSWLTTEEPAPVGAA